MATDYLTTDTELKSVADAIRAKGGTSAVLVYPTGYVSAIQAIQTGTNVSDTTAVAGDVLTGKYFYTSAGTKTQGSMTNRGAVSGTISTKAGTYTVPAGYHNGSGSVAISSTEQAKIIAGNIKSGVTILGQAGSSTVKDVSDTTATASTVMAPYDFYMANGTKTTGTAVYPNNAYAFNPTAIKTAESTIALIDIPGYSTFSINTTVKAIDSVTNWFTQTLNTASYDYIVQINNWLQFVWINGTTVGSGFPRIQTQTMLYYVGKLPKLNSVLDTWTYENRVVDLYRQGVFYYNTNTSGGYNGFYSSEYGFYLGNSAAPTVNSTTSNTPTLTVRYQHMGRCHSTYFKTSTVEYLQNDMIEFHSDATVYQLEKERNWGYLHYQALLLARAKNNYDPNLHPES